MASTTPLPDQAADVDSEDLEHEVGLYRHEKRPEWGVAILAWEKEDRRAYQFEDGRLRKFKEGYYSLMKPAGEVRGSEEALVKSLNEAIEASKGRGSGKVLEPVASFSEQVELFLSLYPEGFQDEKWVEDHRGTDGRELKRHREPAVRDTREFLSRENCELLISSDRHEELVESATGILAGTDLVALKHVKTLRRMDEEEERTFAEAVCMILHGEGDFGQRLKEYYAVLTEIYASRPPWRIATALPALMTPGEHVCVRRSAFIRQAASIAPTARYSKRARVRPYKNFRRVAFAVRKKLEVAGQKPRDLLDVHDFIWATLRNAALDHLG